MEVNTFYPREFTTEATLGGGIEEFTRLIRRLLVTDGDHFVNAYCVVHSQKSLWLLDMRLEECHPSSNREHYRVFISKSSLRQS